MKLMQSFLHQIDNFKMTYGVDKEIIEHIDKLTFSDLV